MWVVRLLGCILFLRGNTQKTNELVVGAEASPVKVAMLERGEGGNACDVLVGEAGVKGEGRDALLGVSFLLLPAGRFFLFLVFAFEG